MPMKFSQIEIGASFYYRGLHYTKTGPLQATIAGTTNPQLIMRSAVVQSVDEVENAPAPASPSPHERLRRAIELYHNECKAVVMAVAADADSLALEQLEQNYRALLDTLEQE